MIINLSRNILCEEYYNQRRRFDEHMLTYGVDFLSDKKLDVDDGDKIAIVEKLRNFARYALENNDLYGFCCTAKLSGDHEMITQCIENRGFCYEDKMPEPLLVEHALRYCDQKTASRGLQVHAEAYREIKDFEYKKAGILGEKITAIDPLINSYLLAHKLAHTGSYLPHQINAAMEIKRMNYDLAIGILNGGSTLAHLVEMSGVETRYLEWRRNWKRAPIWKKMGGNQAKVQQADRILLIEDDAVTGSTLRAVQPLIENLNPSQVDVCFWNSIGKLSFEAARGLDFFEKIMHVSMLNHADILDKMDEFRTKLESTLQRVKVTATA